MSIDSMNSNAAFTFRTGHNLILLLCQGRAFFFVMQPSIIKVSRPYLASGQIELLQHQTGMAGPEGNQKKMQGFRLARGICRQLHFPINTFATAMVLFHRTTLFNPTKDLSLVVLVCSCILLATKIEDTPKKCRDIVASAFKYRNHAASTKEIDDLRLTVLNFEQRVLQTDVFDFRFSQAHQYVIKIAHTLKLAKKTASMAWTIATDMYACEVALKRPAHTTAFACIVLAAKLLDEKIFPLNSATYKSSRTAVNECLSDLLKFYKANYHETLLSALEIDARLFDKIYEPIRREQESQTTSFPQQSYFGLAIRDWSVSETGTARYILNWGIKNVGDELIS